MKLIIVESPNKVKKIQGYVGDEYVVMASVGHIRDLPNNQMGVSEGDFKPTYVSSEKQQKTIAGLRAKAKKADVVIFATDPDREGEAIAWHLLDVLKPKKYERVMFNAITKTAILEALNNPGQIDMWLVLAQEGRRVLDRLVGFIVSPLLKQYVSSDYSLSAGRVQTPATLLVVMREEEIANFKPLTHFKLKAHFPWPGRTDTWSATWDHKSLQKALGQEPTEHFPDPVFVNEVAKALTQTPHFMVVQAEGKETFTKPPAPFSTSTLQQVASTKLGFGVKETMDAAQELFAAGLITYHRTDSLNLEPESAEAIRAWLRSEGFAVPEKQHRWDSKDGAQEAHEAIRPTEIRDKKPQDLPPNSTAAKLYELIWKRTVACQMESARHFSTVVVLASAIKAEGQNLVFVARGKTLLSPGWMDQTPELPEEEDEKSEADSPEAALPSLHEGQRLVCARGEPITAVTKAPPRLTIASLVRELERYGIGRPSTYAAIIGNIFAKQYVLEKNRKLYATPIGMKVIEVLRGRFSFARLDFTKIMEGALDKLAAGKTTYLKVMEFQNDLLTKEVAAISSDPELAKAAADLELESLASAVQCPRCKTGQLIRRYGSGGHFWGCTGFKNKGADKCTATCKDRTVKGQPPEPDLSTVADFSDAPKHQIIKSDVDCPKCKKGKLEQRKSEPRGIFWGCDTYRTKKCSYTTADKNGAPLE